MHLTSREQDRLLVFLAAELARRRLDRGLRLTYPEARAFIADNLCEAARDGKDLATVIGMGSSVLTEADVLPGVPALLSPLQVEATFDDGTKLITIPEPIATDGTGPGELRYGVGEIRLFDSKQGVELSVRNCGDRAIQVGSHYHFFEANRFLEFDRVASFGMRLAIPAGTSRRFEAGQERRIRLVPLRGARRVFGLNGLTQGALDDRETRGRAVKRAQTGGFRQI